MVLIILFTALLACMTGSPQSIDDPNAGIPIRIGWQTTWATQGQLSVLLQQHDWLAKLGFEATFVGFSYGGPLNEGALAGEVDVLFTADQPALVLCQKDTNWGAIGRLMYNRVGTLVPQNSPVIDATELKEASVAIPVGAAAHRETLSAIQPNVDKPLRIYNMGVQEIAALVSRGENNGKWGEIDAVSAWDPVLAELEINHNARVVDYGQVTSLIMMSDRFSMSHPKSAAQFMRAFNSAYLAYQQDPSAANNAFLEHSQLSISEKALSLASDIEPNLKAGADIRTTLNQADITALQRASDFMSEVQILKSPLIATDCIRPIATQGLQ